MADERRRQGFLNIVRPDTTQFTLRPIAIPDPATIKPRQWIYGRHLIRGFVTLLVAPGGTGKSSLVLGSCIAIAINRQLFGAKIYQQCNTALLNLEDPQEEIDRRLAALGIFYNIDNTQLAGRFFMSPPEQKVLIAAESEDGFEVVHPDEKRIIEVVQDNKIGVLAVDPFAESHELEENSNPHMIRAAAAWRRVAREGNCAVLLAHHVRKGTVDSIEAARGAKALTDSARVGLLLSSMTDQEALSLGVSPEERLAYIRLDDAKANLAPRASRASWFHLNTVHLPNGNTEYPHGDQVVVIETWTPTSVWDRLTTEDCNRALDRIRDGLPNGQRYTDQRKPPERWAGKILKEMFEFTDAQAADVLRQWIAHNTLIRETYHDPVRRKERQSLVVNEGNRPGMSPM